MRQLECVFDRLERLVTRGRIRQERREDKKGIAVLANERVK